MGCAFSRGRMVERNDTPSFSCYASMGAGGSRVGRCSGKDLDADAIDAFSSSKPQISEMNSFLGKAGGVRLEKAVGVLDTLGSSMSNLSPGSGFMYNMASRGHRISILAFEVANTIVKGFDLRQSLSKDDIRFLKKEILPSQGIQSLVSTDTLELLSIAENDKREELHTFSVEIARFGDLCKDPQWHNLTRYFQKLDSDPTSPEKLREEAETTMQELLALAQHTSELYHELHALDRLQQDYKQRHREEELLPVCRRGDGLVILSNELKHQKKTVRNMKKKSLWSRNLEEVVEKLVEVVVFLHKEIGKQFRLPDPSADPDVVDPGSVSKSQTLGASGLALHYANIINRIDSIVSRPISMPSNARDILYNGLPLSVKSALRSRLQLFCTEELTVSKIKMEIQKILQWMAPMAENTIKAHQGFGWVGEWANMGTEVNKKPIKNHVLRILTLYHADKEKTDEYILQLVVWLHHLVVRVKDRGYGSKAANFTSSRLRQIVVPSPGTRKETHLVSNDGTTGLKLSDEDRNMLERVNSERIILVRSKSHKFPIVEKCRSRKRQRSWSSDDFLAVWNLSSPATEAR